LVAAAAVAVAAVLALLPSCGASRQSCAAARVGSACDRALLSVHRGQTKAEVRALLGPPDRAPRCWLYRWQPQPSSAVDGARICFSGDRVARVQTAVHG
jgi:hypothetical protein